MNSQISPVQIVLPIAIFAGLVIALFFGINIAHGDYTQMSFIAIGAGVLAWSIIGRKIWWLPIFFFAFLGGHFFYGFKIYAYELAVLLCLLPLVLTLAMKREHFKNRHFGIPKPVGILFLYLCLSFLACAVNNKIEVLGGLGGVTRVYVSAFWPFLIFLPFLLVGNTKYIPWALHLFGTAILIRFSIGMYTALFGDEDTLLFIPGVNFVPAGGFGVNDLRFSGSMLCTLAVCYFCIYRNIIVRTVMPLVMAVGIYGTFLGGGRVTIVLLLGIFAFAFLVYRRIGLVLLSAIVLLVATVALNSFPEVLQEFPKSVKRAASVFLIDRGLATDTAEAASSDEWHYRLMQEGYKSWTENGMTIFLGRGTRPFDLRAWGGGKDFEGMIEMAVATNRYESGLLTILCTFGLVGFVLYVILLFMIIGYCFPVLMREKVKTPVHAIMFIATFQCIAWFLLCWIAGGFPSNEILFGIVAMVAAHDMKRQREGGKTEKRKVETPSVQLLNLAPAAKLPRH